MVPIVSTVQITPPTVANLFIGNGSGAALGRLPVSVVPATIDSAKVADNNRNNPQNRSETRASASSSITASIFSPLSAKTGEIRLSTPFSTPFMAQLFGQSKEAAVNQATDFPPGFVDFERLAQFQMVKYKPSGAFKPREEAAQPSMAEKAQSQAQMPRAFSPDIVIKEANAPITVQTPLAASPVMPKTEKSQKAEPQLSARMASSFSTKSLFSTGFDAYFSVQKRNANAGDKDLAANELNLIS